MNTGGDGAQAPNALASEEPRAVAREEVLRLRHTQALNSQVIASLRARQEFERRRADERASLIAQVALQIGTLWQAAQDQWNATASASHEARQAKALIQDLRDYTAACAGTLTLEREAVHLRRFLGQVVAQSTAAGRAGHPAPVIDVDPQVPVWVLVDARRLATILLQVIDTAVDDGSTRLSSLKVGLDNPQLSGQQPSAVAVFMEMTGMPVSTSTHMVRVEPSAADSLRSALAEQLCSHMKIMLRHEVDNEGHHRWHLALPLGTSSDPATTAELERIDAVLGELPVALDHGQLRQSGDPADTVPDTQDVIDLLYLDRQLGSLAEAVLERTAPAYLALAEERLTKLVVTHSMCDLNGLRDLAQAWKASSMGIGARSFAGLLGAIEKQAASGRQPSEGAIRQVSESLDRLRGALSTWQRERRQPI